MYFVDVKLVALHATVREEGGLSPGALWIDHLGFTKVVLLDDTFQDAAHSFISWLSFDRLASLGLLCEDVFVRLLDLSLGYLEPAILLIMIEVVIVLIWILA